MSCPDPLCCFSGDPVENDPRVAYSNKFKVSMLESPMVNPMWFCYGCMCFPCAHYQLRQQVLGADWPQKYTCCQSYVRCGPCLKPGECGEQAAPEVCLCVEVCCFSGCAMMATRLYMLDKYNIIPDPFDNKILRCTACLQYLACIMSIIAIFVPEADQASEILNQLANLAFHLSSGCIAAQINYELYQDGPPGSGGSVPKGAPAAEASMER